MSADVVAQVKNQLLAAGENIDGPCGAFKITSTVAYRLRHDGWGLIHSTGNGCDARGERYRADTVMLRDGSVIDMLGKSENNEGLVWPAVPHSSYNIPQWNPTGGQPPSNWRQPYDPGYLGEGSGIDPEPPDPEQPGTGVPVDPNDIIGPVNEHTTAETERVLAKIQEVRDEIIAWADKAMKILLLMRRKDEPGGGEGLPDIPDLPSSGKKGETKTKK